MISSLKPVLSSVSVLAMIVGAIGGIGALPASAAPVTAQSTVIDGLTYTAAEGGVAVTDYAWTSAHVVVPATVVIDGETHSVVAIGDDAFYCGVTCRVNNTSLYTVTVGNNVTTIGSTAFRGNMINALILGSKVQTIGEGAFSQNDLGSVDIPSSATAIELNAFNDNRGLSVVRMKGAPPAWGTLIFGNPATATVYYQPEYAEDYGSRWAFYPTAEVLAPPTPSVIGTPAVGNTLTVDAGTWLPGTVLTYAWKNYEDVVFSTAASYTPSVADLGKNFTVTVTGTLNGPSDVSYPSMPPAEIALGTFTSTPTPTISGLNVVGQILSADAGAWPVDAVLTYAWKQVGSDSTIGTKARYAPVFADLGKKLTVTVTATLDGYAPASSTRAQTKAVGMGTINLAPVPTISGTTIFGQTVTAITGTWTPGVSFTYVWKRSGSTATISTDSRYTLALADIGKTLTVTVKATRDGYTAMSKTSGVTATIAGISFTTFPTPTISGTATSGSLLTADKGTWSPSVGVTFSYVWKRSTTPTGAGVAIKGAGADTYRLVAADKGRYISVTVTAVKSGYASTSKTSLNLAIAK